MNNANHVMSQQRGDVVCAWSAALNFQVYDADPGPRIVDVGTPDEPRFADRTEYLREIYTTLLILHCEADVARLRTTARSCRHAYLTRGPAQRAGDLEEHRHREAHHIGAELAESAAQLVHAAGADHDPAIRERYLARLSAQHGRDVFGMFLGAPELADPPSSVDADELP